MPPKQYNWDFFIAHAGADDRLAEQLYDYLTPKSRVFLHRRNLMLGDDWDTELRRAQQNSSVTVVLISSQTEAAYYQREEIAAAITRARADMNEHRVVPAFLDPQAQHSASLPYGLRLKHGLVLFIWLPLEAVGDRLLELLSHLAKEATHGRERVTETAGQNSNRPSSRLVQRGFPEDSIDSAASGHNTPTLASPERGSRSTHNTPGPAPTLFLCYRRDDTEDAAGRLYDRLFDAYGSDRVFMDIDSVPLGVNFVTHIKQQLQGCAAVLVMIGRGWTTMPDPQGNRRLDDPADHVRVEVATALQQGVLVIPILVQNASMPRAADPAQRHPRPRLLQRYETLA